MDEAEKYKTEGNQKLSDRNYAAALEAYSKAIELNPANPIYYGNRCGGAALTCGQAGGVSAGVVSGVVFMRSALV